MCRRRQHDWQPFPFGDNKLHNYVLHSSLWILETVSKFSLNSFTVLAKLLSFGDKKWFAGVLWLVDLGPNLLNRLLHRPFRTYYSAHFTSFWGRILLSCWSGLEPELLVLQPPVQLGLLACAAMANNFVLKSNFSDLWFWLWSKLLPHGLNVMLVEAVLLINCGKVL